MEALCVAKLAPAAVRCVYNSEVRDVSAALQNTLSRCGGEQRLVTCRFGELPALERLLDEFVTDLAEAARLLWPDWYGGSLLRIRTESGEPRSMAALEVQRIARTRAQVNTKWLQAAIAACRAERLPIVAGVPQAVQVKQLAIALAADELVIAVALEETAPPAERLLGFSRALEWLANETQAAVVALLPDSLAGRSELDGINFAAVEAEPPTFPVGAAAPAPANDEIHVDAAESKRPRSPDEVPGDVRPVARCASGDDRQADERKHLVWPILGRPHPASPGEQRLAEELAKDSQLGSLFRFNQRVTSVMQSRFVVDLLWEDGRVVVEVDGYAHHTSRPVFNSDRHRDYELLLSGYLVLRLPHDFVVQNSQLAMERIRDVVEFRIANPLTPEAVR